MFDDKMKSDGSGGERRAHSQVVGLVIPVRKLAVGVVWLEGGAALTAREMRWYGVRGRSRQRYEDEEG